MGWGLDLHVPPLCSRFNDRSLPHEGERGALPFTGAPVVATAAWVYLPYCLHLSVGLSSGPWWQGTGGQPVRELCFLRGFLSALAAFRPDRA